MKRRIKIRPVMRFVGKGELRQRTGTCPKFDTNVNENTSATELDELYTPQIEHA